MGRTGSKQEDQIITAAITRATNVPFTDVPFRGGDEVAVPLVGKHADVKANNPIEAVTHWRSGSLRPACAFDSQRLPAGESMTGTQGWSDIPICKEAGLDVEYLMLRGIFMPPGATADQTAFYNELSRKIRETPEWQDLMRNGAFNTTALTGDALRTWLTQEEAQHETLMQESGFLASAQ